jgi:hypothetical protein
LIRQLPDQQFYVVVLQEGGGNPKPPQRFRKEAFLHWAAKLKRQGGEIHAVYEASLTRLEGRSVEA